MSESDDFPLSPDCWADGYEYYQAFLKAKKHLSSLPPRHRGADPDRTLYELTTHFYAGPGKPEALYRAGLGELSSAAVVWLSRVRVLSEWFVASNAVPQFDGLSDQTLQQLRSLASDPGGIAQVASVLHAQGVLLIYERSLPGLKADGAVFLLPSGIPVVGMSLRHARLDNYWFTLMHELGHIRLHFDQLESAIVDDLDEERPTVTERQADRFASDELIPRADWRSCPAKYTLKEDDIYAFAKKMAIAPQIVAGRLRRELRRHELFSDLVNAVNTREILLGKD